MPSKGADPKSLTAVSVLTALMAVAACQPSESPSVQLPAPSLFVTEEVRIGDEAQGDTVFFENVNDIAVDSKGRIYITDERVHGIRVFATDGRLMRQIGSKGAGPGEFNSPPDVYIGPLDSVYAFDSNNDRLTLFSPDEYELVNTIRIDLDNRSHPDPWDILAATESGLLLRFGHLREGPGVSEVKLLDWNGRILRDSLAHLPVRDRLVIPLDGTYRLHFNLPLVYGRESFLAVGSSGLLYAGWNESIAVRVVTPEGDFVHEISLPHEPIPLTSSDKDSLVGLFPSEWASKLRSNVPDSKPAYRAMVADDEGRLWLGLSLPLRAVDATWLIVDGRTGAIAGTTKLPQYAEVLSIRGGKAYGTMKREQGGSTFVMVWDIAS